jgi:hypothetical protein
MTLHDELGGSRLPNTCNKTEARHKGAQRVSNHDNSRLLEEISRMEILKFDEDEDRIMDCLGNKGEQSIDDDKSMVPIPRKKYSLT